MKAYAANTGTLVNLEVIREYRWGIMLAPYRPKLPEGIEYCSIDNGAWPIYTRGQRDGRCYPFDEVAFKRLLRLYGDYADFVVVPDIVAGGMDSLRYSLSWLATLRGIKRPLIALQDGMEREHVLPVLDKYAELGLFLGGTTEYKLATMSQWGQVAKEYQRWYHVGRVNTVKRIDLCGQAGATSFDGSSATRYSVTLPRLDEARRKYMCIDELEDWRKAYESKGGGLDRYTPPKVQTAGAAVTTGRAAANRPNSQELINDIRRTTTMDIATLLESHRQHFLDTLGDDQLASEVAHAYDRATVKALLEGHRASVSVPAPTPQSQPATISTAPAKSSHKVKAGSKAARERALKAQETRRANLAAKHLAAEGQLTAEAHSNAHPHPHTGTAPHSEV